MSGAGAEDGDVREGDVREGDARHGAVRGGDGADAATAGAAARPPGAAAAARRGRARPAPGQRPTIKAVAAAAGVSTAAVSQAVNGTGRISESTRRKVLEAAEGLGWSPHASASALRSSRTRTLALVVRRPADVLGADPHFGELITGLEGELSPRGYGLLLHLVADLAEERARYERLAAEGRADGAFLTDARTRDPRPGLLRELGLPAVLLGAPDHVHPAGRRGVDGPAGAPDPADAPVPSVGLPQQGAGVREAVEHLVLLGHRRIACVTGPAELLHTGLRLAAFREALAHARLAPAAVVETDFSEAAALAATERLLAADPRPTAVVYANDSMAVCGIGVALRAGLRVPGDLSVVGYDDLPLGRWMHPRLTTVDQQVQRVGAAAARLLLARCGEEVPVVPLEGRPRLVVRESTGPAPAC